MRLRILSWNVKGVNDKDKRKLIKDVIKTQKADLVSLGNKIAGDDEWNCEGSRGRKMFGMGGLIQGVQPGGCLWCFGTIGCCRWWKWRWVNIQSPTALRIVRMVFVGCFQECMVPL